MKTKSRILAALMAFIMIVGMLPISASAEGEATPPAGEAPAQTQETTAPTTELTTTPEPTQTQEQNPTTLPETPTTQGDPAEELTTPESHTLTLKAEPDEGGTVEGGGSYTAGTEVTVTATASDGYVFTAWYEDAEERGDEDKRSEDAEYTFTLNGDLTLCAVFTQQPQADEQTPATPTDAAPGENTDGESGDTGDGATGGKQEAPAAPTFTVTFDANGHGEAPGAASVTEGETVEKPDDPAEEGFSFNGWYRDREATDPWDFDTDTVSGDIRLYASWTEAEPESKSETEPELTYPAFDQSKTDNGVTVHVSASEGVFPEGAELTVDAVPNTQVETAVAAQRDDSVNVAVSYTFDIKVMKDGQECQPGENQTVTVSFAMAQASDQNLDATIYHIEDDTADALDTTAAGGEVSAETDGFSIYTVEFTYNNLEYVLPGNTSVSMSEILIAVGLTGEATAAEVSDESLFSASDATGEWIVTAHQAFSTTEWMKVTISDVVYEITVTDDSTPWAGSGTESEPWLIQTAADLVSLHTYILEGGVTEGKYFKVVNDINLSSVCGAEKGDWTSIGSYVAYSNDYTYCFKGVFDGGGKTISELYIGNGGDFSALFTCATAESTIKNLTVKGYIKGVFEVGGVCGFSQGDITNCHFEGTVISTDNRVGGIVGENSLGSGTIKDCTVSGKISGDGNVGGVAGFLGSGHSLENCSFTGTVTGTDGRVGGIAGEAKAGSSIIDCTVDGVDSKISGTGNVGGIAGFLNGEVNNCHFTGTVTGTGERVGGIAGAANAGSSIIDCTVDGVDSKISGTGNVGGIAGFLNGEVNNCHFTGTVTGTGRGVGGIAGSNGGTDVSIIDSSAEGKISGASAVGGIFGQAAGTVKNCTFKSGTVTGNDQVGGIAGLGNLKLIEDCKSYGDISSTTQRAGGIAGETCGPIKNCENHGSVSAPNYAGGITGHTFDALGYQGTVEKCKNYGNVTVDNQYVGGIVGLARYPITDCENHGRIQGYYDVGGIAGDSDSTVTGCKNYGVVTGEKNVGPIVGRLGGAAMTLKPNGGNGEELIIVTSPTDRTAPACPFTHGSYKFFAWCTAADGAGTWYFEGDSMPTGELTLYAIWMNSRTEAYRTLSGEWNNTRMAELRDGLFNLPGGWYVATGNITLSERLTFTGDANLVLSDNFTLNATQGIHIAPGSSLTIWSQGGYAGRKVGVLNATGPAACAGIGGNKNQSAGTITINGGVVNATGGDYGAGIGGGDTGSGGIVVINGGTVTATGKEGAAGIGGGDYGNGGSVTVSGGSVTAYGSVRSKTGQGAAGIGAGRPKDDGSQSLSGGSVTVSGGRVYAAAGANDANAIGANTMYSTPGSLTIGDGMQAQPPLVGAKPVHRDKRVDTCRGGYVLLDACENHLFDQWRCHTCNLQMNVQDIFDGGGAESNPLLIQSTEDWNMLVSLYNEGRLSAGGYWYRLTNDISVTTMLGTKDHPFNACFDGDGHTLSFSDENTGSSQCVAPFAYVSGVTIRNLRTAGSISENAYDASGLIGKVDKPSVIQNCRVSMSVSGNSYVGGFCIDEGSGLTLTGCVFDGKFSPDSHSTSGGFVSQTTGNLTIRDCLFAPASASGYTNSRFYTFYCDPNGWYPVTITNSYYLTAFGTVQGKQAFSVTAGSGASIDYGNVAAAYSVSGITAYAKGLKYDNTFYAGSGEEISLTLNHGEAPTGKKFIGYDVSAGTLTGNANPYTLTMPEGNVTLTAKYEDIPVTVATVTYKVVGGTWSDGSTGDKTEDVPIPGKPSKVPTGMIAGEGFEGGAWNVDPATATITDDTTFTYTFTAKQPPTPVTKHTVTYVVLNGTWADGSKTNKTEEVEDGKSPTQIPSGMIAAENYEGGAWNTDPSSATITGTTTFTYTFTAKQPPTPPVPATHTVTVSADPAGGGTVTGSGTYNDGDTATVTATANTGYTFTGWTKNGSVVSSDTTYSFTVNEDTDLVAAFTVKQPPAPTQYNVSVEVKNGQAGWGTVTGGGTYNDGSNASVTATANAGYVFKQWTEGNNVVSTSATYQFNVSADRNIVAEFERAAQVFTITFDANGGTVTPAKGTTGTNGTLASLPTPANGNRTFEGWFTAQSGGVQVTTDTVFSSDATIYARWNDGTPSPAATFEITFDAQGGTVTPASKTTGTDGKLQSLLTPTYGNKTFKGWFTAQSGGVQVTTDTVFSSDATIYAHWEDKAIQHTVTVSASPTQGGTVTGGGTYNYDDTATVTASANTGYTFKQWTRSGSVVSTNAIYSFTVNADTALVAEFEVNQTAPPASTQYVVTVTATQGGTAKGGGTYNKNATATVTAIANTNYAFDGWYEAGATTPVSQNASYQFKVTSDRTLEARFSKVTTPVKPNKYTVLVNAEPSHGGTVRGGGMYNDGDSVTVTASANAGYTFTGWTESGKTVSTDAAYTFTANATRNLTAVFKQDGTPTPVNPPKQYSVTATSSQGGTVTGGGTYKDGEIVTLAATPDGGYSFVHFALANDPAKPVSTANPYSFTAAENVTLVAVFAPDSLYYTSGMNGNWQQGSTSPLPFTTNGTYELFSHITVDGKVVAAKDYEAESGSTIIRLKAAFLATLSVGTHTLETFYTNGTSIATQFEIVAAGGTTPGNPGNESPAEQPASTEGQNVTVNTNTTPVHTNILGARSAGSTDSQNARMAQTGDDMYERMGLHTLILLAALLLLIANLRKLMQENALLEVAGTEINRKKKTSGLRNRKLKTQTKCTESGLEFIDLDAETKR